MGEFERIARLRTRFERPARGISLGIGDDCAVLAPSERARVWTVDTAVENVHFDRAFMSLEAIGYRSFMAAASDLAAMGATGVAALSALVLPPALTDAELDQLAEGIARASNETGCPVVGGNLARGKELSLTTSVLGECTHKALARAGAAPGDAVYVSGPLGSAALGLALLRRGATSEEARPFTNAFLYPRARLDVGLELAQRATAAIDVSDGLAQDLGHLCRASRVAVRVELARVPTLPNFAELAEAENLSSWELIASGGEDYEVLFTGPVGLPRTLGTQIGVVVEGEPAVELVDGEGRVYAPSERGFDHFR